MEIELYYADQLVPTGELFRAMQRGTIDAVQSDDDSMASPAEVTVFGGYFPFASRYSLDVPVLFNQYALNAIWDEEYRLEGHPSELQSLMRISYAVFCLKKKQIPGHDNY